MVAAPTERLSHSQGARKTIIVVLVKRVLNLIVHQKDVQHVELERGYLKIITQSVRVLPLLVQMDHPILYLEGQDLINVHLVIADTAW